MVVTCLVSGNPGKKDGRLISDVKTLVGIN
jgi:hypothetical protein